MTDFIFANHGSICLLTPVSDDAKAWIDLHVLDGNDEVQMWGGGVTIEPRYVWPILEGIADAGMTVAL